MRTQLVAAALLALASACAAPSRPLSFATVSFPAGWRVEGDGQTYLAAPVSGSEGRSITVQVCTRAKQDCGKTCAPSELKPNFFYFFDAKSSPEYSQPARTDGFQELKGIGTFGQPPMWVAASVLCGPLGVIYVGATSGSKEDARLLLGDVTASLRMPAETGKSTK